MPDQRKIAPFTVVVHSGETAARQALSEVQDHLAPLELDIEETGTIELVLAEALNNIVEHAYPVEDETGLIRINCDCCPLGLSFKIEDSGRPMPGGKTPLGAAANVDVDLMDMPEGGFGWFLIKDLAKDVEYIRDGDTNILNLRLAITANA